LLPRVRIEVLRVSTKREGAESGHAQTRRRLRRRWHGIIIGLGVGDALGTRRALQPGDHIKSDNIYTLPATDRRIAV
jgi:hypothetical protein